MALEFNDWIEAGKKYAVGYAVWLHCTLTTPWKATPSLIRSEAAKPEGDSATSLGADLSIIIAISVFLGASIGATIPERPKFQDRATVLIVVCGIWLFIGWLIHSVCRLLRGQGSFVASIQAILQVLSAVYVVSNLLTLVAVSVLRGFLADSDIFMIAVKEPGATLVMLQCFALLYYIPASLAAIHQFKRFALVIVAVFSAACSMVVFLPIANASGCAGPDASIERAAATRSETADVASEALRTGRSNPASMSRRAG